MEKIARDRLLVVQRSLVLMLVFGYNMSAYLNGIDLVSM